LEIKIRNFGKKIIILKKIKITKKRKFPKKSLTRIENQNFEEKSKNQKFWRKISNQKLQQI